MKTKTCFKCNRAKPLSAFYRHPKMADGRLGKCKDCTRGDVSLNRADKRVQYSKYEKKRSQTPERKAAALIYQRRRRELYPEKNRARQMLGYHVRKGNISRRPCEICGNKDSQGHHEDYSKPLDVRWLCFRCHREDGHGQIVVSTS